MLHVYLCCMCTCVACVPVLHVYPAQMPSPLRQAGNFLRTQWSEGSGRDVPRAPGRRRNRRSSAIVDMLTQVCVCVCVHASVCTDGSFACVCVCVCVCVCKQLCIYLALVAAYFEVLYGKVGLVHMLWLWP